LVKKSKGYHQTNPCFLDIKVNSVSESGLGLTIPSYRVDVQREIDVIEEILRVYGYNNISFSNKLNATVTNSP
jgi:phenylalanyl-tRNA synthetase beta chain